MPFSGQIYPLLISAPSDVAEDTNAVADAAIRWNVVYGKTFGSQVMPLHWRSHAAAEYGVRPQEALNKQLVDGADVVIALFWHRLGTDTGKAASGTVEEIESAHARGSHVAVLRCIRDMPRDALDPDQLRRLEEYLEGIANEALILEYGDENGLRQHVETILTRFVSTSAARAEIQAEQSPGDARDASQRPPAQVWPTVERREGVKSDHKGRIKMENRWFLVLSNAGDEPALNVGYTIEPEEDGGAPFDLSEGRGIESIPPGGRIESELFLHSGVARQARCSVQWEDSQGEHDASATLRFF